MKNYFSSIPCLGMDKSAKGEVMHKVIKSYLDRFSRENELEELEESERFERFVNYTILSSYYPDQIDLDDVTTSKDDQSIDGVAAIIADELACSADDARSIFERLKPRQQASVSYVFLQAKRSEGFDAGELLKFGSGVQLLFEDGGDAPNDDVLADFVALHEVIVDNLSKIQNGRPECHLYFACTGTWYEDNGLRENIRLVESNILATGFFHTVRYSVADRERLIRFWLQSQAPVEATFQVNNYVPFPEISGVKEAYLAIAPAKEFIDRVLSDDEGKIRSSIFDQNVRAYLGDENPVNTRIRLALAEAGTHDRFAILNNGVTIVSSDVKVQSNRISVTDFQIVNGCQTSHVLFRNKDLVDDQIWIPLKVIEAEDPDIIAQVVEATNSQSDVGETQFFSISPYVRKLEAYFDSFETEEERERRLYFERRTRQFAGQTIGKSRIFDIPKLARVFSAMFLDVPHLAARYPTQAFKEKAGELFQVGHQEIAYYTAALAYYRLELALGNNYVPRTFQRFKWHLLMVLKYSLAGYSMPDLKSRKMESYCEKIIKSLAVGGKQSAPPFLDACDLILKSGEVNRDKIRTQRYTEELKSVVRSVR